MRNLHREKIYYNTPWLISLLLELGINVDAERDRLALRRFILGEKLTPIDKPERRQIKCSVVIPAFHTEASSVDAFFASAKEDMIQKLKDKGIDPDNIVNVDHFEQDGASKCEVDYMRPESDAELAKLHHFADTFNKILAHKDEIYLRIDRMKDA